MSWEVKHGNCDVCGAFGTWLEFIDAQQLPDKWFAITEVESNTDCNEFSRVLLCSVRCVQVRAARAQAGDPTSLAPPPGATPTDKT